MDSNVELRRGAAEWLQIIEDGGRHLQEVVDTLCSSQGGQLGAVGGTVSLPLWLEDMMQAMLDIIREMEEGPAPSLNEFVDWHQADLLMHRCYDIFRRGQDRCAVLEEGLMGCSNELTPTSSMKTNEEIGGNNSLNINNESNDNDNDDIINSGGGGNNTNDNADKNNNININDNDNDNNNDNQFEVVNYSFRVLVSDDCGDKIGKNGIDDNTGAIRISVADNDSTNNIHTNNSHGYGDEVNDDREIVHECSGAFSADVWRRMGVG
ncbi:hypothetical protein CBR_g20263 [Chara braunii]|uniref:Uncharacterized protein n=1 Tax=Chara braunii TaxID=69332 RepID=A0A388KZZ6_CHABU|nr:hypothetical protein CBR_g20263 [Chara braunii]|eukprot:GBG75634.1 hypothetical protein CBR_g20263 [Chara braunii]